MRSSADVLVGTGSPTNYLPHTKQAENRESWCCDRPRYTAWLLPLNVNYGKHSSCCLNLHPIPHLMKPPPQKPHLSFLHTLQISH